MRRILSLAGRVDADQVLLAGKPQRPDISSSQLVLLSFAGYDSASFKKPESKWLDVKQLAYHLEQQHGELSRRLHVFANAKADGWITLKGEQNWKSLPKVKT